MQQSVASTTSHEGMDEMSTIARTDAIEKFMQAVANGETVPPSLARSSGFDTYVLQRCMNLAAPLLTTLEDYKPLAVTMRRRSDINIVCDCELGTYRESLLLRRWYVNTSQEGDMIHAITQVDVYVCRDGRYVVATSAKRPEERQEEHAKTRVAHIIECADAAQLGNALNPMLLQIDPYHDYVERYRIPSPLSLLAKELTKVYRDRQATVTKEKQILDGTLEAMKFAQRFDAHLQ